MRRTALAALVALGCSGRAQSPDQSAVEARPPPAPAGPSQPAPDVGESANSSLNIERSTFDHPDAIGVSGLTRGPSGLFAVPERRRVLLRIENGRVIEALPIVGADEDIDLEAVSWDEGHPDEVLFGTETQDAGPNPLLVGRLEPGRVVIAGRVESEVLIGGPNSGFEGVCRVGEVIVAALEEGELRDEKRHGTLVVLEGSAPRVIDVELTTAEGKLAALDCERSGDALHVYAIERHFGVSRIVHVVVPATASAASAELVVDLLPILREKENFEGIERLEDGTFALVNDNAFGEVFGPSGLVRAQPAAR